MAPEELLEALKDPEKEGGLDGLGFHIVLFFP